VGISSSGNSPNIVNAISAAKDNGAFTITISGKKDDNKIRRMGDINFYVPLETYGEVESAHAVLLHVALDYFLDEFMKGRH
jgi:D-sedoheptulose 7-phosphate isomerase